MFLLLNGQLILIHISRSGSMQLASLQYIAISINTINVHSIPQLDREEISFIMQPCTYVPDDSNCMGGSIWLLGVGDVQQRHIHLNPYPFTRLCEDPMHRSDHSSLEHHQSAILLQFAQIYLVTGCTVTFILYTAQNSSSLRMNLGEIWNPSFYKYFMKTNH